MNGDEQNTSSTREREIDRDYKEKSPLKRRKKGETCEGWRWGSG